MLVKYINEIRLEALARYICLMYIRPVKIRNDSQEGRMPKLNDRYK